MAGKVCVAEVEELVETGEPSTRTTCTCPASTCNASWSMPTPEKRIEQRTIRQEGN
jgi:3-oxoacid CoA-transferase subunit A